MTQCTVLELRDAPYTHRAPLPCVLTIAGSDSSGGAGVEADLKTFGAHGVYGLDCITALTSQNTVRVADIEKTSLPLLQSILNLNLDDFLRGFPLDNTPLKVVKTGMLTTDAVSALLTVLPELIEHNVKLIIDPVISTTSGSRLSDQTQIKECISKLIRGHAFLVTPNYDEARALFEILASPLQVPVVDSQDLFKEFAVALQKLLGCQALLVKGGHIPFDKLTGKPKTTENDGQYMIVDVLYESESSKTTIFRSDYIVTNDSHGTGCTLASAIAANVAKGEPLVDAVALATDYIHLAMVNMSGKLGHGNGPLNHCVTPEFNAATVLQNPVKITHSDLEFAGRDIVGFLTTHDSIKDQWKKFTHHPFILGVGTRTLPFDSFLYYLKQDYHYLINYAQVTAVSASIAPTYAMIKTEARLISNILNELEKHKAKLLTKFNIDFDGPDADKELAPGKSCLDYCEYLFEVSKTRDYLAIKTAVAPCLHGYYEAGKYGELIRDRGADLGILQSKAELDMYNSWLDDYKSEWFAQSHFDGKQSLQSLVNQEKLTPIRLAQLLKIFSDVVNLEVDFWDVIMDL